MTRRNDVLDVLHAIATDKASTTAERIQAASTLLAYDFPGDVDEPEPPM